MLLIWDFDSKEGISTGIYFETDSKQEFQQDFASCKEFQ